MMTEAHARPGDPVSSHEAAARMAASHLEQVVYDYLLSRGVFLTSIEIAEGMGVDKWSISPRMRPLFRKGHVEIGRKLGFNSNGKLREMLAWRAVRPR